jgi:hypothetical protein
MPFYYYKPKRIFAHAPDKDAFFDAHLKGEVLDDVIARSNGSLFDDIRAADAAREELMEQIEETPWSGC